MTDPKVKAAISAALSTFAKYGESIDVAALTAKFDTVFSSEEEFMDKVDDLDEVFDDEPKLEALREVFFDLLMVNFFSADVVRLEEDYLDTPEWEAIEEETLDRGTELLNLLLYLTECADEDIEPGLEDYLKEFLLVDDDEFQDEYSIYEPIIENQILIESPASEIAKVASKLPDNSELKELFYPIMCFFQQPDGSAEAETEAAASAPFDKSFEMAVYQVLVNFR
ncbi:hypothetical protein C8P68_10892 [Mucilaginibacter yixingensis]|uniref:Uncharacterized protein n=1 Tax=Mucilaginibacter yixingensis TaxID=1295612 RepID=A0A2T5J5Y5_9SPHI|nr:hypothetical protein [Mucilaginibacter yixingensis]PTQ93630.1 hypothetical protein C8P68_10892 [Mucilaginibacter yixingensis]